MAKKRFTALQSKVRRQSIILNKISGAKAIKFNEKRATIYNIKKGRVMTGKTAKKQYVPVNELRNLLKGNKNTLTAQKTYRKAKLPKGFHKINIKEQKGKLSLGKITVIDKQQRKVRKDVTVRAVTKEQKKLVTEAIRAQQITLPKKAVQESRAKRIVADITQQFSIFRLVARLQRPT